MEIESMDARRRRAVSERRITVGELREHLGVFDDDDWLMFSDTQAGYPLVFYRTKSRGEDLCQIELREATDEWVRFQEGVQTPEEVLRDVMERFRAEHGSVPDYGDQEQMRSLFAMLSDRELRDLIQGTATLLPPELTLPGDDAG